MVFCYLMPELVVLLLCVDWWVVLWVVVSVGE